MASKVAAKAGWLNWNTIVSESKLYFSRHPFICGYIFLAIPLGIDGLRRYCQLDFLFGPVHKYRRYYLVLRPEDPGAKLVKRNEIGLDRV